jgi:hypothetical protein
MVGPMIISEAIVPICMIRVLEVKTRTICRGMGLMGSYYYMPYISSEIRVQRSVQRLQIPPGELAICCGTHKEIHAENK